MKKVTILIPTIHRKEALCILLTSLCLQTEKNFDIVIADQTEEENVFTYPPLQSVLRLLSHHGSHISLFHNLPNRGIAQQRQFLLDKVVTPYALFVDDDLILESYVVKTMLQTMLEQQCGFVGSAVIGLSYKHDIRPHEQAIEFWKEKVEPEEVIPHGKSWHRAKLHNAANILHVGERLGIDPCHPRLYKVSWVGACVLYDTEKLRSIGGFTFWKELPKEHAGEDVLAQLRVMKQYGGCGIIPSGVYHQELPTTIPTRDVNAPEFLSV